MTALPTQPPEGAGVRGGDSATADRTDPGRPAAGEWRRLSPLTVWAGALALAGFAVPGSAIGAAIVAVTGGFWPWGVLIVAGGVLLVAAPSAVEALRWRRARYRITGERLEVRRGLLVTEHLSVPRDRVRSVDVSVEIWLRPFGLCKVTVGTGQSPGSGDGGIRLEYVARAEGDRLRRELLLRGGEGSPTAAGDGGAEPMAGSGRGPSGMRTEAAVTGSDRELARLRPVWIGFAPMSAAAPTIGVGIVGGAFNVLSWFGQERANATAAAVFDRIMVQPLIGVPGAVAAVLLVGAISAAAVQLDAWWDYRLDREPDGTLRLRRGLITSTSLSLEERRLRGVELREPLALRWVGGARVRAVATGLETDKGKGGTVPRSALSPDMPRKRALRLSAEVVREAVPVSPLAQALRAHPRAALRRRINRAALGSIAVAAAAAGATAAAALPWAPERAWPAVAAAALAAVPIGVLLLALWAVAAYRGLGHGLAPDYLVTRKGALARATVALRRDGIIGWRISRSPFQRRAGLATVTATTAAGRGRYATADVDLETGLRLADEAVPHLLAQFLAGPEPEPSAGRGDAAPRAESGAPR